VVVVSTVIDTSGSPPVDRESLKVLARAVTASNGWDADELSTIDGTSEVDVATRRGDGTLRAARIVWIVRHGDAVYVRSVNGTTAAWYRGVQTRREGELGAGRLRRDAVLRAGESVSTQAGEVHFHGGTAENMMCHYAILDASGDGEATTWLEPVTGEEYSAAHSTAGV